jgi:hypothetical protein
MTVATWTTAPIPASELRAGDRIDVNGEDVTLTDVVENRADVTLQSDRYVLNASTRYMVTAHVPDEPVDGYNLWKPKLGVWPGGCVCVSRRVPDLDGNWEIVARDEECRGHYDNYEEN